VSHHIPLTLKQGQEKLFSEEDCNLIFSRLWEGGGDVVYPSSK